MKNTDVCTSTASNKNKLSFDNIMYMASLPSTRKRILRAAILVFLILYVFLTIMPFYVLFVRTFVQTKDATDLHLWLPPVEEVNMDAGIGHLSIFYNLDIEKVKQDLGIPATEYLNPNWDLNRLSKEYDIPEKTIRNYFTPFTRYNGWIALLFSNTNFLEALQRTFIVTLMGLVGINLLGILTGAGLAGLKYRYQRFIYALYLLEIVIPPFLILLPQFYLISQIRSLIPGSADIGSNTRNITQLVTIIALYIKGGALSTMIYTMAVGNIPHDLKDAAEVDGASRWQYILYILLPLMKVPIASVTVIMLPTFWNDFLQPFVYLDPKNTTLLPFIQTFTGQYTTNFQIVFTGVLVSILPLLIVYIIFRKWFVAGAMEGAIKG